MLIEQTTTAVESYSISKGEGLIRHKTKKVFEFIKANQPCSNKDIELGTGLDNTSVGCARWHLIQQKKIRVAGLKVNKGTDREVETVEVNPTPEILFKKKSNREKLEEIMELCKEANIYNRIVPYTSCYDLAEEIISIIKK